MSITLVSQKKGWILHQSRTAVFYQTECWAALFEIERLIKRNAGSCPWDVFHPFFVLHPLYSGRYLDEPDVALFLDGMCDLECMERRFQQFLKKDVRAEILAQLRKANWTYDQLQRIAKAIGFAIKRSQELVLQDLNELATVADDGCQVKLKDFEDLILGMTAITENNLGSENSQTSRIDSHRQ